METKNILSALAALAQESRLAVFSLLVQVGPVIEVFDRIMLDPAQRVQYHFVLIDYLCRAVGGRLPGVVSLTTPVMYSLPRSMLFRRSTASR